MKKAGLATAGVGLLGSMPLAGAFASGAGTIRVALVGCGGRGSGAAAQALKADPDVKLVAVADVFQQRIDAKLPALKQGFGDRVTITQDTTFVGLTAYKQAIDLADVVILATPPGFRPEHFSYAVAQNKHVFMEKPLATDIYGVKQVLATHKEAVRKKLNVVVGLQRRYQDTYLKAKQLYDEGSIGEIVGGQLYWNSGGVWTRKRQPDMTELAYQLHNWYYFTWICGDHIAEQHIHNLDVANWFKGGLPTKVRGFGGRVARDAKTQGQIFDHFNVELIYEDGTVINSQCRHVKGCWNSVKETFVGEKGTMALSARGEPNISLRDGSRIDLRDSQATGVNPYQAEHDVLFAAIKAGEHRLQDAEVGAMSTLTAVVGRMATYSGQEIEVAKALASDHRLVPELTSMDDEAPVQPLADGTYPVAMPGTTSYF